MLFFERIIIGIFIVLQTTCAHLHLYLNDKCKLAHSNETGICQYVEDCPAVEKLFNEQHINPTLCGFERDKQIVCCPKEIETRFGDNTTEVDITNNTVSSQKCIEYQNLCSESTALDWESDQITPNEFPFMAAIGLLEQRRGSEDKIVWFTGGTLISKNYVLLTNKRLKNLSRAFNRTAKYIRVGITDLEADMSNTTIQFDIAEIFIHPLREQNTRYNDIALIKIDGEVEFTESIRPACLGQPESVIAENLLVTGWGQIDSQGTIKMDLQKVRFNLVSHADCDASYNFYNPSNLEHVIINETQLCARSETRVRDACQGFGGAPLINTIGKPSCLYEVIGLTSLGLGCGNRNPGVFTRVSAYLDWIENIVWSGGNEDSIVATTSSFTTNIIPSTTMTSMESTSSDDQTTLADEITDSINFNTSTEYAPRNNISLEKCAEYQTLCSESTPLRWEGDQITPKEFPFMAAIGLLEERRGEEDKIIWFSGGTLISRNFVMSTTKRLGNNSPVFNRTAKYIRLGITNLMVNISDDSMVKQFDIAQIFVHPLRQNTRYNDIALFRIDGEVEFTEYIRPACLAQPESVIAENLLVTGWGQINSRGTVKMDLQKIRFNLVSHADCYASYKFHNPSNLERGIDNETQICARSETKVRDACQGFGGSPLINTIGKPSCLYEVIGLTSLGIGCGTRNPGAFTRVSAYLDWIETIVWSDS